MILISEETNCKGIGAMDTTSKIESYWDTEAESGGIYSRPRLDLTRQGIEEYARGPVEEPGSSVFPRSLLLGAEGKDVLCLAAGGGQQSAVFGLLGARLTVLDISTGQLRGDALAAEHYGYDLKLVKGDMRDLSAFADGAFDLVYQPISICFVPDVKDVYDEVYRVLKPGGVYAVSHINPATFPTSFVGGDNGWDGIGYRIAEMYTGGPVRATADGRENMTDGAITGEYRHLLSSIFGGLLDTGFVITDVVEDPRHLRGEAVGVPGSYEHSLSYVAEYFKIVCSKPK